MTKTLLSAWKNAKLETTLLAINVLGAGLNFAAALNNPSAATTVLNIVCVGGQVGLGAYFYEKIKSKIKNAPAPN